MEDLISRSALIETIRRNGIKGNGYDDYERENDVIDTIECEPSVEAVPVVHGEWIYNGIPDSMLSGCSVCGFTCGAYSFNFCPNCGAYMRRSKV